MGLPDEEAAFRRDRDQLLGNRRDRCAVAPLVVEHHHVAEAIGRAGRDVERFNHRHGFAMTLRRLLRVSGEPQAHGEKVATGEGGWELKGADEGALPIEIVQGERLLRMLARGGKVGQEITRVPNRLTRDHVQGRILGGQRHLEHRLGRLQRQTLPSAQQVHGPQSPERAQQTLHVAHALTEISRAKARGFYLARAPTERRHQRRGESQLHVHFGAKAFRILCGQCLEERERLPHVGDAFAQGRALLRLQAGLHPAGRRLVDATGAFVVTCQQLWLRVRHLREAADERFGDLAVELLPGLAQQRLVRRILNERVLEQVGRGRRRAALRDELEVDEMLQCVGEGVGRFPEDALQQLETELAPNGGRQLRHRTVRSELIDAPHQRGLHRVGDETWRQWPGELVPALEFTQDACLDDRSRHGFHEQGDAAGASHQFLEQCQREGLTTDDTGHQAPRVCGRQGLDANLATVQLLQPLR